MAVPILVRENIIETLIAVNMTAIKLTDVAYQKNILIFSIVAFIANVPVQFAELKDFLIDLNNFSFPFNLTAIHCDPYVLWESFSTTWTSSWWLDPFFDALVTEFMATAQLSTNVGILIEADCAQIFESGVAVILWLDFDKARLKICCLFGVLSLETCFGF